MGKAEDKRAAIIAQQAERQQAEQPNAAPMPKRRTNWAATAPCGRAAGDPHGRAPQMSRAFSGGKRNREASRDLKKRQKEERLRRNRELRARGIDPDMMEPGRCLPRGAALPEVKLEDIVIGVAPQSRQANFGPTKLFVGGLGPTTTEADLRTFFSRFGELVEAVVIPNRSTGQSRGFGFVSYQSSAAAEAAIKGMNGVELDGHPLKVNRAEARPGRCSLPFCGDALD